MRRTIITGGASLVLHTLAVLWIPAYRELVFDAGAFLIQTHHMEDIPQVVLAGFLAIGALVVALGVIAERSWRYL